MKNGFPLSSLLTAAASLAISTLAFGSPISGAYTFNAGDCVVTAGEAGPESLSLPGNGAGPFWAASGATLAFSDADSGELILHYISGTGGNISVDLKNGTESHGTFRRTTNQNGSQLTVSESDGSWGAARWSKSRWIFERLEDGRLAIDYRGHQASLFFPVQNDAVRCILSPG